MNKKLLVVLLFSIGFLLLMQTDVMAQCSMCRKIASDGADKAAGTGVSNNLNTGIIYLMIIPYFLLLFIFRKQLLALYRSVTTK